MPVERADRIGSPWTLAKALAWRTRREGLRYLLVTFLPFLFMLAAVIVPSLLSRASVNDGAAFATFAIRDGARADTVTVGLALLIGPGFVAMFAAVSVATLVRNLIGSEASRGGIEALLAGPYRPMSIMVALVGYVGVVATLYWAGMTAIAAVTLAIVVWASAAALLLPASYLVAALVLPLLAAWAATGLSLLVTLLYPRLAQAGSFGLNLGSGGIGTLPAVLPALGVLLVFTIWAPHVGAGALVAIAGSTTAVIAAGSIAIVARRFHPDAVLEA